MKIKISPALALWFIAPILAEMFSGSTPLNEYLNPFVIVVFGMLYGSGAILIRELALHWKKGWASLLLLGMAYGIYEEGLMVRSFFDPNWEDLGNLGEYGRAFGVNWVWSEHLTIFHALISIAASIAFIEMLYPDKRTESWIGTRGLTWNALAFAASLTLGALLNPYDAPDAWLGMCWLAIATLTLAAWHIPATVIAPRTVTIPRPRRFWWMGFLGAFGHFFLIYVTAENNNPPFVVAMFLLALYDLFLLWLVVHWSGAGQSWDDRHKLALIIGSLSFFLILGPLTTNGQYPIMVFSNPIFLLILWWVYRKVNRRVMSENGLEAVKINPANQVL
jgi:hypothetical protein